MKNESEAEDSPDESHSTEFKMIREIPNLKGVFDRIIVTTKEANSSIMTVMNLVTVLSSSIQDMSEELVESFLKVNEPLINTTKSLNLVSSALHQLGTKCIEIEVQISESDDDYKPPSVSVEIKEETLIKEEEENELSDLKNSSLLTKLEFTGVKDDSTTEQNNDEEGNLFHCSFCSFSSIYMTILEYHKKCHKSVGNIPKMNCPVKDCSFKTAGETYLEAHFAEDHVNQCFFEYFICDSCDFSTLDQNEQEKHLLKQHKNLPKSGPKKQLFCDKCEFKTFSQGKMDSHMLREHIKEYSCKLCEFKTAELKNLNFHKRKHTVGKYKCEHCDYTNHSPFVMKKHMRNHHDIKHEIEYMLDSKDPTIKYYFCSATKNCNFRTTKPEELDVHFNKKHSNLDLLDKTEDMNYIDGANGQIEEQTVIDDKIEQKEYQCTKCDYRTTNKMYYDDHLNGNVKYWRCPITPCSATFLRKSKTDRKSHLVNHHGAAFDGDKSGKDLKVFCGLCKKKVKRYRDYDVHIWNDHNLGISYHCSHCDKITMAHSHYLYHIKQHNEGNFICPFCGTSRNNQPKLNKHIYESHVEASCEVCNETFKNRQRLEFHKLSHKKAEDMFVCDECGQHFPTKGRLGRHVRYKHNTELLHCSECEYTSYNPINLRQHSAKHKPPCQNTSNQVEVQCDKCDYKCVPGPKLNHHKYIKHGKGRVSCEECGLKITKSCLPKHMFIKHSGSPPTHKCLEPGCSYSGFSLQQLTVHKEKVHEGIRYPCELCDYVCSYRGDLKRHKRIVHEGYVLQCSSCDYSTTKNYQLKDHMLKEHGVS